MIREDDQHVFDNYLNGIQKLDSGYMIMPSYTKMMMDCDVNNVRFPTPANLTIGGTLNDVLNTHILYVL